MTDQALQASGLGVRYGSVWALSECTFDVPRGSVAMLAGPNGAGKSTLLSVAAGLTVPTAGRMSVLGSVVTNRMHPDAAFVSQQRQMPAGFTVQEILRMGRALNGGRWAPAEFAGRLLEETGVSLRAKAGTLSDGARSLLAITLALARRPEVLLLDEPLSPLDPLARDEVLRMLMTEVAERGMTVLTSSHVPGELQDVCDHLILLSQGKAILTGNIDELVADHRILVGPSAAEPPVTADAVVHRTSTERQASLLVRGASDDLPGWHVEPPSLDALVRGYLRGARGR